MSSSCECHHQAAQYDRALALVDLDDPEQQHMKGPYCFYLGCLAEALEDCQDYDSAQQTYELLLRIQVDFNIIGTSSTPKHGWGRSLFTSFSTFVLQPLDPKGLGNYALFLYRIRKDYETAAEIFLKVCQRSKWNAGTQKAYPANTHPNDRRLKLSQSIQAS